MQHEDKNIKGVLLWTFTKAFVLLQIISQDEQQSNHCLCVDASKAAFILNSATFKCFNVYIT